MPGRRPTQNNQSVPTTRSTPDHAVFLAHRQRSQAMGPPLGGGEGGVLGPCDQRAVETVDPAVIGADEVSRAGAAAVGDAGAAMAADVEKGADRAVGPA